MRKAFSISFGLVFIAELGDKSQLGMIALYFSTEDYLVLPGVYLGYIIVSIISVALGREASKRLEESKIQVAAGLLFVIIGIITLGYVFWDAYS